MAGGAHKHTTRNVSVSNGLQRSRSCRGIDSDRDAEAQKKRFKPRCNMCCAWTSLIIGSIIILILIVGGVFYAFLQANMPEFSLHNIEVLYLDVSTSPSGETLLTSVVEVRLNVTNKNAKTELSYRDMKVDVTLDDLYFGTMHLPSLHQKTYVNTDLKVVTNVTRMPIEEADGKDIKLKAQNHLLMVDVSLTGAIDYFLNGNKINGFPFKVVCEKIAQVVLDAGGSPECHVKMTPVR